MKNGGGVHLSGRVTAVSISQTARSEACPPVSQATAKSINRVDVSKILEDGMQAS